MLNIRFLAFAAVIAGATILCGSARAQNTLPVSTPTVQGSAANAPTPTLRRMPRTVTPRALPSKKPLSIEDVLSGITLTDEQKPKIAQVQKDMRARMQMVANDAKETSDQKQAMIEGLQRMELHQVYMLLTPDQRIGARKKIMAERDAEQQPPQKAQKDSQSK